MKTKLILCDGDSWTAGDVIDPELKGDPNQPANDQYRLPRVWPHKLGKLLNIDVVNKSVAGSSNDAIVRRIIPHTINLLKKYKPEEIFVIIGWSSPERKDFYYKGEWESWETLYPSQIDCFDNLPHGNEIKKFYKTYLRYYWNFEEYVSRFINQNLYLHYFFKNKNIDHLFFNAFYESSAKEFGNNIYLKFVEKGISGLLENTDLLSEMNDYQDKLARFIGAGKGSQAKRQRLRQLKKGFAPTVVDTDDGYKVAISPILLEEFLKISAGIFKKESFRGFIMKDSKSKEGWKNNILLEKDYHPSEKSHELWAKELYKDLKDKI